MGYQEIFTVFNPKKHPKEEDIATIPSYIFCKWLSGHQFTVAAANEINKYHQIPMVNQYNMIKNAFQGKQIYIKYPSSEKDPRKDILLFARHFKVSEEKAKEYMTILSEEEQNKIIDLYKDL